MENINKALINTDKVSIDINESSYIFCAFYKNGNVEIIPTNKMKRIIPEYITLNDTCRLVGIKFSDRNLQKNINNFPFKIINDGFDRPQIVIGKDNFYAEEVNELILQNMKEYAEEWMNEKINNVAVVNTPCKFINYIPRINLLNTFSYFNYERVDLSGLFEGIDFYCECLKTVKYASNYSNEGTLICGSIYIPRMKEMICKTIILDEKIEKKINYVIDVDIEDNKKYRGEIIECMYNKDANKKIKRFVTTTNNNDTINIEYYYDDIMKDNHIQGTFEINNISVPTIKVYFDVDVKYTEKRSWWKIKKDDIEKCYYLIFILILMLYIKYYDMRIQNLGISKLS